MKVCTECSGRIGARSKSGVCRACSNRRLNTDPELKERRRAGMLRRNRSDPQRAAQLKDALAKAWAARKPRTHEQMIALGKLGNAAKTPEIYARAGKQLSATRLAWCPPHLRAEYIFLSQNKRIPAAEARAMIEDQHEMEMARWRRSVGIEVAPTPFEPVEPDLTPLEAAIELVAHRCKITVGKLFAEDRHAPLVRARSALAVAMRRQGYSQPGIARAMHKGDHTTAQNWIRKGEYLLERDRQFASLVDELIACWHQLEVAA